MFIMRSVARLPWRRLVVDRGDQPHYDHAVIHAANGRTYRAKPPFLSEDGDLDRNDYLTGLSVLMQDIANYRTVRIKTRFRRVVAVGCAVPHCDIAEMRILDALGVDLKTVIAAAVDHLEWDDRTGSHGGGLGQGVTMSGRGRVVARIEMAPGVVYSMGCVTVPSLPDTITAAAAGMPLADIVHDDRLAPLGLVIGRVENLQKTTKLHVLPDKDQDPRSDRFLILDDEARKVLAEADIRKATLLETT